MSREVMKQAFVAMSYGNTAEREAARIALREALGWADATLINEDTMPEQEPVAYHYCFVNAFGHPVWDVGFNVPRASAEEHPLYRHPPQRQPLTDEEIENLLISWPKDSIEFIDFARAIELHHGIGDKT